MKKLIAVASLLTITTLTGCQTGAQTAAPSAAPTLPATVTQNGSAPRTITGAQLRRVLAGDTSATLWGINYSMSEYRSWGRNYHNTTHNVSYSFAGHGTLVKADYNRFVYQVPDDQVLIINRLSGGYNYSSVPQPNPYQGAVSLNGFGVQIFGPDVHYVFGPGELVVITMHPNFQYAQNSNSSGSTSFHPLSLSGYVGSPDLLAQTSSTRASK